MTLSNLNFIKNGELWENIPALLKYVSDCWLQHPSLSKYYPVQCILLFKYMYHSFQEYVSKEMTHPVLYSSLSPIVAFPRKTGYMVAFPPGEIWLYSSLSPHSRISPILIFKYVLFVEG